MNLLPAKGRASGGFLGEGKHRPLRLSLVAAVLLALLAVQLSFRSNQQNLADLETVQSELAIVDSHLRGAEDLRNQIQALQRSREIAELDWRYLTNRPPEVMEAIAAVITTSVGGIRVTSVDSDGAFDLTVQLRADTHSAALEWRRQITAVPSVQSVAAFGASGETAPFQYQATIRIASGGQR